MAEYFEKELHFQIPANYPFVGAEFNATSAGIHVDGLIKNEEIYNIFNTEKILGRPISIIITDKSGTAGIVHWLNKHLNLSRPQTDLPRTIRGFTKFTSGSCGNTRKAG